MINIRTYLSLSLPRSFAPLICWDSPRLLHLSLSLSELGTSLRRGCIYRATDFLSYLCGCRLFYMLNVRIRDYLTLRIAGAQHGPPPSLSHKLINLKGLSLSYGPKTRVPIYVGWLLFCGAAILDGITDQFCTTVRMSHTHTYILRPSQLSTSFLIFFRFFYTLALSVRHHE